jgi:TrmH RNA methyltransferase
VAGLAAVSALFHRDPDRVVRLFYEDRQARQVGDFCGQLAQSRRPYRKVDGDELTKIAGTVLHGGVVAIAAPQPEHRLTAAECKRLMDTDTPLFVLDGIGNPHNVGAIARSLVFFGFEHLVLSDHPQQAGLSDAAYRIAEGGLDCLTVFRATNLPALLREIKGHGRIVGTALSIQGQTLEALQSNWQPSLMLLGNEEHGLSRNTLNQCDVVLTLPGSGAVQSLNVAATAAIIAHALRRR